MKFTDSSIVVISGASSGMGKSTALLLAAKGTTIVALDLSAKGLLKLASDLSAVDKKNNRSTKRHVFLETDVSDADAVFAAAKKVFAKYPTIDAVFNFAGIFSNAAFDKMDPRVKPLQKAMNVNFYGTVYVCKAFFDSLNPKAAYVVNISSLDGLVPMPGALSYACSKFAVSGFTYSLKMDCDLTHPHVRVACVHPGMVVTDLISNSTLHFDPNMIQPAPVTIFGFTFDLPKPDFSSDGISDVFKRMGSTTADEAADQIVRGLWWNKSRIIVGTDCSILESLHRFAPRAMTSMVVYYPALFITMIGTKLIGKKVVLATLSAFATYALLFTPTGKRTVDDVTFALR